MARKRWLVLAAALASCGGPDALSMSAVDDGVDDVETVQGELTATSRAATWLPLQEGNRWVFSSATGTRTVSLSNVGNGMALLTGLFSQPTWVGAASPSSTTLLLWNGAAWVPFVRFGYARTAWRFGDERCTAFVARRSATGLDFSTPAGDFTDTRSIAFEPVADSTARCTPPAFTELTFVPRVGLAAFTTGRGERFVLASASVDGMQLPTSAITARVTLDAERYTSRPNTLRCVTQPCPDNSETAEAKLRFEVRNTSSAAQSFRFTSDCHFDVEVLTAGGRVVASIAERRTCRFAASTLVLQPGEAKVYEAELELEDSNSLQLDGDFTLRAWLSSSSSAMGAPVSASVPLQVRVVSP